jgi:hypothetical protein
MTDYTDNTYSSMALLKHPGGRWEIVSAERVLEDAEKAYAEVAAQDPSLPAKLSVRLRHLVKLPYEWRLLFMDETPREFRFDKEDIDDEGRPNGRKLLFGGESSDPSAILDSKIILSLKTEEDGRIDGEYAERVGKALEDFMNGVFPLPKTTEFYPPYRSYFFRYEPDPAVLFVTPTEYPISNSRIAIMQCRAEAFVAGWRAKKRSEPAAPRKAD